VLKRKKDPTMSDELKSKKQEVEQLEKSIAAAQAKGDQPRAEALEKRLARVRDELAYL
jgi:uncharacterized protein YlxW (UPF0749 family)